MEFLYLLSPTILLLSLLSFLFYKSSLKKKSNGSDPNANFSTLVKNGHRYLDWTTDLLLASPTNTVTLFSGIVTSNPSNIEHVLKNNFENYPKGERFTTTLQDFLGHGIFNSDGEHWKLQRKIASLEFNTKSIRSFVMTNVQAEVADRLLPILSAASAGSDVLDLQDVLERFAFDNVCKVAFNVDPARLAGDTEEGSRFAHAFEVVADISTKRFREPGPSWKLRRLLNLGSERRLREELSIVNDFAMKVVRERRKREEGKISNDFLSRFITEGDFSDEFLRDIVISFVLAGRDTTSTALTWFFWIVSSRPAVQQKILEEIKSVRSRHGNKNEIFTLEELREMEYLHAALSETLRLYPPVALEPRTCVDDDVLPDGTKVGKGATVMYNSYAMGRMESIWGKDCKEYRPERWLEKGVFQPKNPFRFPIFHAGPRMCLGKEMAYIQMKAVAASVLERFEIDVAEEEREREHEYTIILRMKGGLPVKVRERQGKDSTEDACAN